MRARSRLVLFLCLLSSTVQSDDTPAKQLFEAMELRQQFETMADRYRGVIGLQMETLGFEIPEESIPILERQRERIMKLITDSFLNESVQNRMTQEMEAVFTDEELLALTDFFRSPVGRIYVEKMPQFTVRQLALSQEVVAQISPQLQQIIAETQSELREAREKNVR